MVQRGSVVTYRGEGDYYNRAMAAYFRAPSLALELRPQPNQTLSGEYEVNGKHYVLLANVNGVLAVYRIKPDGFLRRLRRWPRELEDEL